MNPSSHTRGHHQPVQPFVAPLEHGPVSAPPLPSREQRLSGKGLNELPRPSQRIEAYDPGLTAAIDAVVENMAGTGLR